MYQSVVQSVMYYGAGIWGNIKVESYDIKNKDKKFFLAFHKYAPNAAVLGDMVWLKSKFTKQQSAIGM